VHADGLLGHLEHADAPDLARRALKYWSTNAFSRPTASKSCAPQYDMYVETPIFDMIFERPLPTALT
jgi:hypothetical protein